MASKKRKKKKWQLRSRRLAAETDGKKMVWLAFDLGLQGDYEGLYTWLAKHGALECGDGLARLRYPAGPKSIASFLEKLQKSLRGGVKFDDRARIYVIFRDKNAIRGRWLVGHRRRSPWEDYLPSQKSSADDVSST